MNNSGSGYSMEFGSAKPVYLNFALKSFQKQIAYRFEYFIGVLNGLLFIFVFTSLWRTIYADPTAAQTTSFTKTSIISYAVFAMLIRISMTMDDGHTASRVRTGAIAMDMIKPVNYFFMLFAEAVGQSMFHWFTRVIPILLISILMLGMTMPKFGMAYVLSLIAWVSGYLILYMINFVFSLLAFWFVETFSFQLMKFGLFTLFSGGIAPVDFFPYWLRPLMDMLPFQYIIYVPASILISHLTSAQVVRYMGIQALWVLLLSAICSLMWMAAKRKLITQGG